MKTKQLDSGLIVPERKSTDNDRFLDLDKQDEIERCLSRLYFILGSGGLVWKDSREKREIILKLIEVIGHATVRPDWKYEGELLC